MALIGLVVNDKNPAEVVSELTAVGTKIDCRVWTTFSRGPPRMTRGCTLTKRCSDMTYMMYAKHRVMISTGTIVVMIFIECPAWVMIVMVHVSAQKIETMGTNMAWSRRKAIKNTTAPMSVTMGTLRMKLRSRARLVSALMTGMPLSQTS
jgi:hypothetical protein